MRINDPEVEKIFKAASSLSDVIRAGRLAEVFMAELKPKLSDALRLDDSEPAKS